MLKAPIKALFLAMIALFIFAVINPAAAEEFYYRGPKLNPQIAASALFLTPIREKNGNSFTLDLVVDPADEEINTVSTEISFPTDKLSLENLSKGNSFCSFFVEEKIDNALGKIKISCLAPYPGTDRMSNVISLTFKQINTGTANLNLSSDSLVLANDGYGTNVLKDLGGQTIVD
ncbi:MAG: cohesin domain-containing protein [Patescibacteria group bacterium]|nr:cohesin domain-containing protein [Patescibacteria group bacterium]